MEQDGSHVQRTNLELSDFILAKYLDPKILKDSTTYQKILRDGRTQGLAEGRVEGLAEGLIKEARRIVLRLGTKRFGTPEALVLATLEDIREIDRLEELSDRILDADVLDWNSLLEIG